MRITNDYSLHRVVYSLFEDVRSEAEKQSSIPSGILFADKGGDAKERKILTLSDRPPRQSAHGEVISRPVPDEFLQHPFYKFEVTLNATRRENKSGKRVPIKTREKVAAWFGGKSLSSWGFSVDPARLDVRMLPVMQFNKQDDRPVTHGAASVSGMVRSENRVGRRLHPRPRQLAVLKAPGAPRNARTRRSSRFPYKTDLAIDRESLPYKRRNSRAGKGLR